MKLAILEAGAPPGQLAERFGRYPAMFANLLDSVEVGPVYDVTQGEYPLRPEDHAAYLVTGSAAGVYDDLPWIAPLKNFLLSAKGRAKLIGVCFGHQIMAEAFGGRVTKSEKGWGVGLACYRIFRHQPWMDDGEAVSIPVSHQDQVVAIPPGATVIAGSDFCDIGMLAYDDQPAISVQFHPEFSPDYARALIDFRRERLDDPDAAIASLAAPNDSARVAAWLTRFLSEKAVEAR